jgi:flagellar biosynthesis GTPase FlhF
MLKLSNQGKIMDKRIGAGGIFAVIIGIITLGGLVSVGLLRKTVGTVLIMLVGIYAVSNIKGDFFDMIKDYNARSEASEIRRLEFEREKMRFEAETDLKTLELEAKKAEAHRQAKESERLRVQQELARQEKQAAQERIRKEKQAEQNRIRKEQQAAIDLKNEAEDKVNKAKQAFASDGFKVFEKNNFRETQYKLMPVKWVNDHKIISAESILSRNELTTATNGMKWQSERLSFEVNCGALTIRTLSSVVTSGPWGTGEVLRSFNNNPWSDIKDNDWRKVFADKFCQA